MADDRPETPGSSRGPTDFGRSKRPGPTIELEASRVADASAAKGALSSDSDKPADTASPWDAAAPAQPDATPVTPEEAPVAPSANAAADAPVESPPDAAASAPPRKAAGSSTWAAAGAGAVAAAAVVLASSILWPTEPVQHEPVAPPQVTSAMVDALNARLQRVEARPAVPPPAAPGAAPAGPDPAVLTRLDDLEKSVTALRGDAAAVRSAAEQNAAVLAALKSAPVAAAPAVDLTAINNRIGQLERAAGALRTQVAEQSARPADDQPLRRVIAASLLDVALRQGEPYAAPLTAARSFAPDPGMLAPLDAFAATGLPSAAVLARDLQAQLGKLAPPPEPAPPNASFLERLEAGAMRLVRIRRTDAVTGDGSAAIVGRISAAARRGDIAEARRDIDALPPADRATLQPWTARYDARQAALTTSHQFAADAMAALTKPAP